MDNSNVSRNRQDDPLGVNKMGKNIRKSPLHQPNFSNTARQQPQPQVYNINKNDFRNIVQQLTGSPSREPLPRPSQNLPKPPSTRLQKIRPPPLTPINQPQIPRHPPPAQVQPQPPPAAAVPYSGTFLRPAQFGQPSPQMQRPLTPGDSTWTNVAESPISAYMRYLQNSFVDSDPRQTHAPSQLQHQPQPHVPGLIQAQPPPPPGLLPNPPGPPLLSPRMNAPSFLASPTSQFLLPSPSGYWNQLSPRSPYGPYPLLSPSYQFPPLTPNFSFSPMAQSGILGPAPQPLPSPRIASPTGFFSVSSPRWRNQQL